ncbi:hypothetical protein TNCV_4981821 [Trichonephila clavipes]|nr:hypothetical protein TNCV_4981821 [Trichonephila clavipes]
MAQNSLVVMLPYLRRHGTILRRPYSVVGTWGFCAIAAGYIHRFGVDGSLVVTCKHCRWRVAYRLCSRTWGDRRSLVVKITVSWLACHEFAPSTAENPRVGERCTLNLSRAQMSIHWQVWHLVECSVSSGVDLVT